jgi:hypothetical protein
MNIKILLEIEGTARTKEDINKYLMETIQQHFLEKGEKIKLLKIR